MTSVSTLRSLVPMPKSTGVFCSKCDKPQARWTLRGSPSEQISICSLCVLYETAWGKSNAAQVKRVIDEVQVQRQVHLPLECEWTRLARCEDADSVLGVLVLVERAMAKVII